jgi:hypothetical protein
LPELLTQRNWAGRDAVEVLGLLDDFPTVNWASVVTPALRTAASPMRTSVDASVCLVARPWASTCAALKFGVATFSACTASAWVLSLPLWAIFTPAPSTRAAQLPMPHQ